MAWDLDSDSYSYSDFRCGNGDNANGNDGHRAVVVGGKVQRVVP